MKLISGLADIINNVDTFILDQWGVLHNGGKPFPKALQALQFLKKHKKKVVIVSNSGNTGELSNLRLQNAGISEIYI